MHYASAMVQMQLCIVQKTYLMSVWGCAQCSVAGHQEVLAHTVTIHRRHPISPTFYLQGVKGRWACVCRVVLRLVGGGPRGAWVPGVRRSTGLRLEQKGGVRWRAVQLRHRIGGCGPLRGRVPMMDVLKSRAWATVDPGQCGSAGYRAGGGRQGAVGALFRTVGDGQRPGGHGGAWGHTEIGLDDPT